MLSLTDNNQATVFNSNARYTCMYESLNIDNPYSNEFEFVKRCLLG